VFLKLSVLFAAWKSTCLYAVLLAFGVGEFSQDIREESQFVAADVFYIGIAASLRLLQQRRGFLAQKAARVSFVVRGQNC
jgi:hypothetical protein